MDINEFKSSLGQDAPPDVTPPLQALWFDAKGDWQAAHRLVQDDGGNSAAWVHAYLHRKEGDASNAAYWYRRAGKPVMNSALETEWNEQVTELLAQTDA